LFSNPENWRAVLLPRDGVFINNRIRRRALDDGTSNNGVSLKPKTEALSAECYGGIVDREALVAPAMKASMSVMHLLRPAEYDSHQVSKKKNKKIWKYHFEVAGIV
jgi:hypothetical protein